MALVEENYRNLVNALYHNNLQEFKEELNKSDIHPRWCIYSKTNDSLVHVIVQNGRLDFLQMVLHQFPNDIKELLQCKNADGKTPLHVGAQFAQHKIISILLENDVEIDPIKKADWTPLMLACTKSGDDALQSIDLLVSSGANINLQNKDGWTPFHLAAREGHPDIISYFIRKNPKLLDTKSKNGRTPLHTACIHGRLECIKMMLQTLPQPKFYLDVRDSCGASPIMDAARGGHIELVKFLCQLNPESLYTQDILGRNLLHIACHSGHKDLVEELILNQKMDLSKFQQSRSKSVSPLHWAAKEGHLNVVESLLKLGADPQCTDQCGRTPLALAIGGQHVEVSRALIEHANLAPFDVRLLELAKSDSMKNYLVRVFSQRNIVLYLPGTY